MHVYATLLGAFYLIVLDNAIVYVYYIIFLQAHREVFEYLIEDFKTYKPLLSAVKNEYEMMLAYQRQVIRELEPLKVRLNAAHSIIQCISKLS